VTGSSPRPGEAAGAGEEAEKPSLSTEEDAEIAAILDSPTPLKEMQQLLDDVAAGETNNKKLMLTLLTSGKSANPREREMILLKSRAGAGKTTLIESLIKAFKTKVVGRFSEHALDYSDLSGYEILYLKEVGHMDEEEQGVSTLKFLSADDQGYTVEVTMGSPQEGFTTVTRRIPPMTIVSSTTRVELDPQFERRCWIIYLDESSEQTDRIREWIARQETEELEVALGLREELSRDRAQRLLHALVEEITPCHVTVLFPRTFLRILEQSKLRVRGDFSKLMRMLKYYGRLRRRTLPKVKGRDGTDIVFVTPQAALDILKVAWEPLTLMTLELDKRTEKLLDGLEAMGWTEKGAAIPPDKRAELALKMGYASDTVYRYLNNLEKVSLLSSDGKRPKTYYLLESLESIRRKASALSGKLDNPDDLILEMCREAQKTLETLSGKLPEGCGTIMSQYFTHDETCAPAHPPPGYPESDLGEETPQKPERSKEQPDNPEARLNLPPLPDIVHNFLDSQGDGTTILRLQAHLEGQGYSLEGLNDELGRLERQEKIIRTLNTISLGPEWRKPTPGGEPSPARGTPAPPPSGGAGVEAGVEERPGDAGEGPPPLAPFEAVRGIWTGLAKDEGGAALLGDLGVLLGRDGVSDPYGLIIQASSPGWREREGWRIELVGVELRPLGEEGECAVCSRRARLYADVEGVWRVCLRCRLGQPATTPDRPWRFRMVTR
jgi:hypothetical protein